METRHTKLAYFIFGIISYLGFQKLMIDIDDIYGWVSLMIMPLFFLLDVAILTLKTIQKYRTIDRKYSSR